MNIHEMHKIAVAEKLKGTGAGGALGMLAGGVTGSLLGPPAGITAALLGADKEDRQTALIAPTAGLGTLGGIIGAILGYKHLR